MKSAIPADWDLQPLGALCSRPQYGLTETASSEPIGPRFLRITDIQNGEVAWETVPFCRCSPADLERHRVGQGDILVARIGGTTGKTFFVRNCSEDVVFASYLIRLRARSIDERYLYYFCQSQRYWNHINASKDERLKGGVNTSLLTELEVPVPPMDEQVMIADLLEAIESFARFEARSAQRLRALKSATMAKLFREGLHSEHLKQTEIGELPASWDVVRLGDHCELKSGGTPPRTTAEYWGGEIPWVKTTEVDYSVIRETEEKITASGLENSSAKLFDKGTLLMAMYGQGVTRGRVALLGIRAATNQACAAFFPDKTISTRFLYSYFCHAYEHIRELGHGANQRNLSLEILHDVKIPVPRSLDEQEEISNIVSGIERRIEISCFKDNVLSRLFATTLECLMTGAVRLKNLGVVEVSHA